MRRHLSRRFSACVYSLIDLAHERERIIRASDIRVDIQVYPSVEGRKTIRNARLGSPLFVEMLMVSVKIRM